MKRGQDIHAQVEHLREQGHFLESLKLSEEALLKYQEEKDLFGIGDILASRSITLRLLSERILSERILSEKTEDTSFLILAKHDCMAACEIVESSNDKANLIMPLFRLGQVQEDLNETSNACVSYKRALEIFEKNPPKEHNRPAVLNDLKIRLAICEYKNGDNSALIRAEEALSSLEKDSEEAKYTKDVWVSGGYMKLAEVLRENDPQKAKEYLNKAKEIIDANSDLKIRKLQLEKLSSNF